MSVYINIPSLGATEKRTTLLGSVISISKRHNFPLLQTCCAYNGVCIDFEFNITPLAPVVHC